MKHTKKIAFVSLVLGGSLFATVPQVTGQGIGVRKLDEMLTPSKSRLERGKKIYAQNCASCHGSDGAGNTPTASSFEAGIPNLVTAEYRQGGGPIQVYNVISKGTGGHPVFNHLAFQDRWAATHFARSLGPTSDLKDPQDVVEAAIFEAKNGVCDEKVKAGIADKVEPKGEEQFKKAAEVYAQQCASCHGDDGAGDGAAGGALSPKPRDFTSASEKWTNGTSPLAIFNTLAVGVEGTGMAAFAQIPEEDRWALVHYLRAWIPDSAKKESTPDQIDAVCRAISSPPKPESISVENAMKFLVADASNKRAQNTANFGVSWLTDGANVNRGKAVYRNFCSSCHGVDGVGQKALGPFGAFPPYLFVRVDRMTKASTGGTFKAFAERSTSGAHTTIPGMTAVGQLSSADWQALQTYIATEFEGDGVVKYESERAPAPAPETPAENPDAQ